MGIPEENAPETLMYSCLTYCVTHLDAWCYKQPDSGLYTMRNGLTLPAEICEALLRTAIEEPTVITDDAFFHIFKDTEASTLKRVCVSGSGVTDRALGWLLRHKPLELDISRCAVLTRTARSFINLHGARLQTLLIGDSVNVLTTDGDDGKGDEASIKDYVDKLHDTPWTSATTNKALQSPLTCTALRAFSVHGLTEKWNESSLVNPIAQLILPFPNLTCVDLMGCTSVCVADMYFLPKLSRMVSLILYDVPLGDVFVAFKNITALKNLRMLDIGQGLDGPVQYENPEHYLEMLITGLPNLERLDLSGTNLPSGGRNSKHSNMPEDQRVEVAPSSLPGFKGRHLDFLGLLGCGNDACMRNELPARQVTGHATEEQVLLSIHQYVEKPELLVQALNHLFQIFRFSVCNDQRAALHVILLAMQRHPLDKHIQISGSASLFYIVKGDQEYYFSLKTKRKTISAILDGMDNHTSEVTMMRNGCLTLCHFKIPQDVLFEYKRMVTILLRMVTPQDQEEFVQRIGIYLLNSLSCQVDGTDKQLVGDLGAISTLLQIIENKLDNGVCDEVMEIAWSTMWNVTDETAVNCERFIQEAGMELFLQCLEQFPEKPELLRNMMGLMGNVAEVAYLRPHLRHSEYVQLFSDLLDSDSDGIEVSYNACGVLAHMMSDGADAWLLNDPPRVNILVRMVEAITRWSLKTKRNINYRSFEPILRLLHEYETPECQHWAVWALCNLTTMYSAKYCSLLEKEGALDLIVELVHDPRPYPEIRRLATSVLHMCEQQQKNPQPEPPLEMDVELEPDAADD